MGTSKINISHAPEGQSRPSLLSTGAPSADHNILDAIGDRAATPQRSRLHWWWLLPLVAATVWGIATQLTQAPFTPPPVVATAPRPATPPASAVNSAPVSATASLIATTTATATERTEDASATASVNPFSGLDASTATTAPLASGGSTKTTPVATKASQRAAVMPPPFDLQAALDKVPPRASSPNKPAAEVANKRITQEKPVAASKPAAPPANAKTLQAARKPSNQPEPKSSTATEGRARPDDSKQAVASKKPPSRDPDVELLSAIMKHLNDGKGNAAANPAPRSTQTIADLVRSCKTQDSIDALLCQRRICEGSWGKAQACPMSQAPKTAQAQPNH